MGKELKRQIEMWENRVFFPDEKFKEDTTADLDLLNHIIKSSKENFSIILSSSEASVYKIGRYFIENGIDNESLSFQDGDIFGMYIDVNAKYDNEIRDLVNNLVITLGNNIKNKWLIIPELNCQWSNKFATFFISKLKIAGVYGLLFYSDKSYPDTLGQILCTETYEKVWQFPAETFKSKKSKRKLKKDEF